MNTSKVFKDAEAPCTALLACFINEYGSKAMQWEAETIKLSIGKDFGELPDLMFEKLQAAITVLTSDLYETNPYVFETCSYLLNGVYDEFDTLNPLPFEDMVLALAEARLINHEPMEFSDEVRAYMGLVFYEYGFAKPPKLFPTAIIPPEAVPHDKEDELNAILQELYDTKMNTVLEYIEKHEDDLK